MKKNVKLFGSALILCAAMISCENNELELEPESGDLKKANMGMIKSYENTMVLKWNEAFSIAIDSKMPLARESRIYAMVSLAVHDALNNVVPKYETYAMDNSWNDGKEVSKKTIYSAADAAVAQAAHDVLVTVYPLSKPNADNLLSDCLSSIEDSEYKDMGIQIGKDAAQAMLIKRQNDVLPIFETYPQGTQPGEYRSYPPFTNATPVWPGNAVYGPSWGDIEPFGILSGDQFRPAPPYEINSPEYTADYYEVKTLGSNSSPVRTPEQTSNVVFFTENMPSMMNRVAKAMIINEELDGYEAARLLALTHMTVADAIICAFDGNFHYNFWRPVTAIHEGVNDGNADTVGDPTWAPVTAARATPPVPSYPSGYSVAGKAGTEMFKIFFGTDEKSFTVGSYTLPGTERSFTKFSGLATEMGISRIYGGHNFRNDQIAGELMGKKIAKFVYENNLKELKVSQLKK